MLSGKRPIVLLLLAGALAGCGREEPRAYQAPKDSTAEAAPPAKSPPWKVPPGWEEKPSGGGMRVASYGVKAADGRTADISVTALAGTAGGVLENVNRWRGQIGLEPITTEQLTPLPVKIGDQDGTLFELASDKLVLEERFKARVLAALLPAGDMTVFFKMTGEDALVTENKPRFLEFLKSVNTMGETSTPPSAGEPPVATAPTPPPGGPPPPANMRGPVAPPPATSLPKWDAPAHWKSVTGNSMRLASYEVPNDGGTAGDLSVTALGPAAGGTLANVNRWRGQLGLAPLGESDLPSNTTPLELADGTKATFVDLKGTEGRRMLAAIVGRADRTWFFKLTGDEALLGREKESFTRFVKSVKY